MDNTNHIHDPSKSVAAKIIDWSVNNRFFVMLGALVLLAAGVVSITKISHSISIVGHGQHYLIKRNR